LDADIAITHRDVILVEDIIDTGTTMTNLYAFLRSKQPNSLKVVALLDKPSQRTTDFHADYIGKTIPNVFVIGYGLDYNEQYRNLPYIGTREGEKDH
jgi:hypoxanthine phosphoribosyltransferase